MYNSPTRLILKPVASQGSLNATFLVTPLFVWALKLKAKDFDGAISSGRFHFHELFQHLAKYV
jgi:hypothetical protein